VFQKYVPADVVRRALEMDSTKRLSTKQVCTVLFSDIRGFTSMSERMEPEAVVSFLNDYLQRMVDIVFDEGGIVDKFIGDAVMAVFGAPFPKPDDAVRAVRAGHRMLEELDRFNEDQAKIGGVNIRIGIGIHTGPVIAGNIGSDKKMEYTVIGDTVNIASRVESLCKEHSTEFIITQACYDATRRRIAVRPIGPVSVKGKENTLMIYEALRRTVAGQAAHAAHAAPVPAGVGGRELRTLEAPVIKSTELTGNRTAYGAPELVAVPAAARPSERRVRPMTIPPPPIRPATRPMPVIPPPPSGPAPKDPTK
jgi:adenylate cyclase